jgi:hypothetical protein
VYTPVTGSVLALCYLFYAVNAGAVSEWIGIPGTSKSGAMSTFLPVSAVVLLFLSVLRTCW